MRPKLLWLMTRQGRHRGCWLSRQISQARQSRSTISLEQPHIIVSKCYFLPGDVPRVALEDLDNVQLVDPKVEASLLTT